MFATTRHAALLTLSLCAPLLAACERTAAPAAPSSPPPVASSTSVPSTALGRTVQGAMDKARNELETKNIDLSRGVQIQTGKNDRHFSIGGNDGHARSPHAEITPRGDLLIDGKPTPVDAAQRRLLMDYRRQIIAIAETGMAIGVQGADLAGKAVLDVIAGVLHGNADSAGKRIEAEGRKLELSAKQICEQLPLLRSTQQQLAASLPAFRPYATMKQSDIDDCMDGHGASVTSQ